MSYRVQLHDRRCDSVVENFRPRCLKPAVYQVFTAHGKSVGVYCETCSMNAILREGEKECRVIPKEVEEQGTG